MEKHRVKVDLVIDVEAESHQAAIDAVNSYLPTVGTKSIRMECWTPTTGKTIVETKESQDAVTV